MSASKKIILRVDKGNPKLGYLRLQTIINRKSKEKSLKIKVQVKNWNPDKQFVYSTEPDADKINQIIQQVLREEKGEVVKKVDANSFIDFAENKILPTIPLKSTRDSKKFALNKLKGFLESEGKTDLLFPEIDLFFIKKYYNYLQEKSKPSTANAYITNFKYFVNQAEFHDHFTFKKDPFKKLKKNGKDRQHSVMTPAEVDIFFKYEPEDESFQHVQNGFGFSMYTAGMRISDLLNLRWDNFSKSGDSYHLKYYMQKTNKLMTPKLTLEALQFLLPFIEKYDKGLTKNYNKFKKIQDKIFKTLDGFKQELKEHKPIKISDLQYMKPSEYGEMFFEGIEREKRETYLIDIIADFEKRKVFNRTLLTELIADACLKLKDSHPTETVFPHCRYVPEADFWQVQNAVKTQFNYRLNVIQKKTGIKTHISNHQARHVFAQRLFEAGANFHHISLALGHSSLKITESYRDQLITDEAKDVVEEFRKLRPY